MTIKKSKSKKGEIKTYVVSQIFILILSLFAISFMIGEADRVSAVNEPTSASAALATTECTLALDCAKKYGGSYTEWNCKFYSSGNKCEKKTSTTTTSETDKNPLDKAKNTLAIPATVYGSYDASKKIIGLFSKSPASKGVPSATTPAANLDKLTALEAGVPKTALGQFFSNTFTSGVLGAEGAWQGAAIWSSSLSVVTYAAVAVAVGVAVRYAAEALGASVDQSQTLGTAAGIGTFAGLVAFGFVSSLTALSATGIGAAVAAVIILFAYKKEPSEIVAFQCLPYVPPVGGDKCEVCNNKNLPCTEYQCKSLGRGCELVNKGTGEEMCVFANEGDLTPPNIQPWEGILTDGFVYNPLEVSSMERGARVLQAGSTTQCVPPFTQIRFGITLDEPAVCKVSNERSDSYEEMENQFFSNGLSSYNHSLSISFPDKADVENQGYVYDEGYNEWFVRCQDAVGNENVEEFVFRFCVDDSPDLRPPVITETNPKNGGAIAFDKTTIEASFFMNKPSECKWDYLDKTFDQMEKTMTCFGIEDEPTVYNNNVVFPCKTELTGLANYQDTTLYVRCKSYPSKEESARVQMESSYKYTLKGTRALEITELLPDEVISGSSDTIPVTIQVKTTGGLSEGKSICSFANKESGPYAFFYNTNSYTHTQDLWLQPGVYNYFIRCSDEAGNIDTEQLIIEVESDLVEPIVARAYYEDGALKLVTNEEANCVYSTFGCDYEFKDGMALNRVDLSNHYLSWDTTTNLYVKCQDIYENRPTSPTECSIIVRAYEEFVAEE